MTRYHCLDHLRDRWCEPPDDPPERPEPEPEPELEPDEYDDPRADYQEVLPCD